MDNQEVSAFAAYSQIKKKKKKDIVSGSKLKLKHKHKLKKKSTNINSSSISVNGEQSHSVKKDLINSLLKAKKDSLFKDVSLSGEVENVFLTENDVDKKDDSKKNSESKKSKKRKLNGEFLNGSMGSSQHDSEEKITTDDVLNVSDVLVVKPKKRKKKLDSATLPSSIYCDSVKLGEEVLKWLLSPFTLKNFFESCWEKKPLHISHQCDSYFNTICTMEDFKKALKENDMYFTRNIDVTSYVNGERLTENPEGKATIGIVWDLFRKGKSIRLLNPQTFIPNIRIMNTTLQEFFQCFVGANIYLTPAGTQGFAPHYDDIEAFVLQLDGEKLWKLYSPRSPEEELPRESSRNFDEDEIGEPILEVTLRPGDLLYFPRGFIHQAKCLPHVHSLHVTVSCYQKNSWADLLEKLLPVALQRAINDDVEFRKGLPIGYLNHLGMVYYDHDSDQRREFISKFQSLAQKVIEYCPLDAGVDQMGANFLHDALPPSLTEDEKLHGADREEKFEGKRLLEALKNSSDKNLRVKLIRATAVRLVSEQDETVMYYTTDNSLVYHEHEPCSVTLSTNWAQAVDHLVRSYPNFVDMKELPVSKKVNKAGKWNRIVDFVYFLWQKGLILFDTPIQHIYS